MPTLALLFLTLICLSHVAVVVTSRGMTLFIRDTEGYLSALDLPSDATCSDLYIESQLEPFHTLLFTGIEIEDNHVLLADIGICPETIINVQPPELLAVGLYNFVRDMTGRENILWFDDAFNCFQNPNITTCSIDTVYQWNGISSDDIWSDDYSSDIPHVNTLDLDHLDLGGIIHWDALPKCFEFVSLSNNEFTNIDFSKLKRTSIKMLELSENAIDQLDLHQLSGSVLEYLDLQCNQISEISFHGIGDTSLDTLELGQNRIDKVDLKGLAGSKLKELCLFQNQIEHFPWIALLNSDLERLDLLSNAITNVDMESVKNSNLIDLMLQQNQIKQIDLSQLYSGMTLQYLDLKCNPITEDNIGIDVEELMMKQPIQRLHLDFLEIDGGKARRLYDLDEYAW